MSRQFLIDSWFVKWNRYIYWRNHGNHCAHVIAYYGYMLNSYSQE